VSIVGVILQTVLWLFFEATYSVTDPPLKALRRVIPPLRIGSVALDLGFLVLIIAVQIGLSLVSRL
jgi:YggT family protein